MAKDYAWDVVVATNRFTATSSVSGDATG
jgi:hypothetical protein